MHVSAWTDLEASLYRLERMRELGAPGEVIAAEIELAKRRWRRVPLAPAGTVLVWPAELLPLARELGFEPDTRGTAPHDPALANGVAKASQLYQAAERMRAAIAKECAVIDLSVSMAGADVILTGSARDAAVRDRAGQIAAELEPTSAACGHIHNRIVVEEGQ